MLMMAVAAGLASMPSLARASDGFDLTGEWHGTQICDELDGGKRSVFVETSPIFIRQLANGRFRLLFRLNGGAADIVYEGVTQPSDGGREGIAIACGGAFRSQEVVRLRPLTGSGLTAFFNGESQFFTNDFPGSGGTTNFGTCKYAYQRVVAAVPTIKACAVSPIMGM
jgi:hypothetical protein